MLNKQSDTRRTFLKGVAGTGVGGLLVSQMGTAGARTGSRESFIGHTYDPVTHKIHGRITAQLDRSATEMVGRIQTPGMVLPIEATSPSPIVGHPSKISHATHDKLLNFNTIVRSADGPDISVKLLSGNGITGYFKQAGTKGRTAFKLSKVSRFGTEKKADSVVKAGIRKKRGVNIKNITSWGGNR